MTAMTNAPTLPAPACVYFAKRLHDDTTVIKQEEYDALRASATTLRDQLAEAQREKAELKRDHRLSTGALHTVIEQRKAEAARADANEKDARILDWLEDESKCYWVEVQSQPAGDVVYAGSGKALREAITAALAKS